VCFIVYIYIHIYGARRCRDKKEADRLKEGQHLHWCARAGLPGQWPLARRWRDCRSPHKCWCCNLPSDPANEQMQFYIGSWFFPYPGQWSLCFLSGSACSINSLMEFVVMSDVLDWVPFEYDPTAVFFCFIPLIKHLHHPCTNLSLRCQTWAAFNARLTPTLVNIAFKIFFSFFLFFFFFLLLFFLPDPAIYIYTHTTSPDYFDDQLNWM
jgi:hypothetical protein